MKIWLILLLVAIGYAIDFVIYVLGLLGIPFLIASIVAVLVFGGICEKLSLRHKRRSGLARFLRTVIFGLIVSITLMASIPWILVPVILFIVVSYALST